jgi:hypothetical protein
LALTLVLAVAVSSGAIVAFVVPEPQPDPRPALAARASPSSIVQVQASIQPGASIVPSLPAIGSPTAGDPVDPPDLRRFPGSTVVSYTESEDGSISWILVEYHVAGALQDDVREHYRQVFRDSGWFVGDIDYSDSVWTFKASQGHREARLEISVHGTAVRTVAFVSDETRLVTPAPAVAPAPRPQRTPRAESPARVDRVRPRPQADERPRQAPERRTDRDEVDDVTQPPARVGRRPRPQTDDRSGQAPERRADRDEVDGDDDDNDDEDDDDDDSDGDDDSDDD